MTQAAISTPRKRTNGRNISDPDEVTLDTRTGATGSIHDWMERFAQCWTAPAERLEDMLALLSDDVVLEAPTIPPRSEGKDDARAAFLNAFRMFPTLVGQVHRYSFAGEVLFIEWSQSAMIGKRRLSWRIVDRFLFRDGVACERIAYFDALRIRNAILASPASILQYMRFRRG